MSLRSARFDLASLKDSLMYVGVGKRTAPKDASVDASVDASTEGAKGTRAKGTRAKKARTSKKERAARTKTAALAAAAEVKKEIACFRSALCLGVEEYRCGETCAACESPARFYFNRPVFAPPLVSHGGTVHVRKPMSSESHWVKWPASADSYGMMALCIEHTATYVEATYTFNDDGTVSKEMNSRSTIIDSLCGAIGGDYATAKLSTEEEEGEFLHAYDRAKDAAGKVWVDGLESTPYGTPYGYEETRPLRRWILPTGHVSPAHMGQELTTSPGPFYIWSKDHERARCTLRLRFMDAIDQLNDLSTGGWHSQSTLGSVVTEASFKGCVETFCRAYAETEYGKPFPSVLYPIRALSEYGYTLEAHFYLPYLKTGQPSCSIADEDQGYRLDDEWHGWRKTIDGPRLCLDHLQTSAVNRHSWHAVEKRLVKVVVAKRSDKQHVMQVASAAIKNAFLHSEIPEAQARTDAFLYQEQQAVKSKVFVWKLAKAAEMEAAKMAAWDVTAFQTAQTPEEAAVEIKAEVKKEVEPLCAIYEAELIALNEKGRVAGDQMTELSKAMLQQRVTNDASDRWLIRKVGQRPKCTADAMYSIRALYQVYGNGETIFSFWGVDITRWFQFIKPLILMDRETHHDLEQCVLPTVDCVIGRLIGWYTLNTEILLQCLTEASLLKERTEAALWDCLQTCEENTFESRSFKLARLIRQGDSSDTLHLYATPSTGEMIGAKILEPLWGQPFTASHRSKGMSCCIYGCEAPAKKGCRPFAGSAENCCSSALHNGYKVCSLHKSQFIINANKLCTVNASGYKANRGFAWFPDRGDIVAIVGQNHKNEKHWANFVYAEGTEKHKADARVDSKSVLNAVDKVKKSGSNVLFRLLKSVQNEKVVERELLGLELDTVAYTRVSKVVWWRGRRTGGVRMTTSEWRQWDVHRVKFSGKESVIGDAHEAFLIYPVNEKAMPKTIPKDILFFRYDHTNPGMWLEDRRVARSLYGSRQCFIKPNVVDPEWVNPPHPDPSRYRLLYDDELCSRYYLDIEAPFMMNYIQKKLVTDPKKRGGKELVDLVNISQGLVTYKYALDFRTGSKGTLTVVGLQPIEQAFTLRHFNDFVANEVIADAKVHIYPQDTYTYHPSIRPATLLGVMRAGRHFPVAGPLWAPPRAETGKWGKWCSANCPSTQQLMKAGKWIDL